MSLLLFSYILLLFIIIRKLKIDSLSKNFILFYLAWWGVILVSSAFNPFGLYKVDGTTYLSLLTYITAFIIGFTCLPSLNSMVVFKHRIPSVIIRVKIIPIIIGVIFVFIVYTYVTKYLLVIEAVGASQARLSLFESGELFQTNYEIYLFQFVFDPIQIAIQMILASYVIYKYKIPLIYLILLLVYFFLYGYLGGGRANYMTLFMYVMLLFVIRRQVLGAAVFDSIRKMSLKLFTVLLLFSLIILIIVCWQTSYRMGATEFSITTIWVGFEELIKQIGWYILGPIRALDHAFRYHYEDTLMGYWYGRATLGGFETLLKMGIHATGGEYISANQIIGSYLQEHFITIGSGLSSYNFAYTALIFFYLDFGYFGFIIIPIILGLITRLSIFRFQKKSSYINLMLMLFLFYSAIFSFFSWLFYKIPSVAFVIILLIIPIIQKINEKKSLCWHECRYYPSRSSEYNS